MQACLDRSSVTECKDHVGLPNIKVDSFAIPKTSAVQITLILHLARYLLSWMGELIKSTESSQKSDRGPRSPYVADFRCDAFKRKDFGRANQQTAKHIHRPEHSRIASEIKHDLKVNLTCRLWLRKNAKAETGVCLNADLMEVHASRHSEPDLKAQ